MTLYSVTEMNACPLHIGLLAKQIITFFQSYCQLHFHKLSTKKWIVYSLLYMKV